MCNELMKAKPAATAETWAVFSPPRDQKSPHHGGKISTGFFFPLSELKPDSHESSKWCQPVSPEGDVILDSPSSVWGLSLVRSSDQGDRLE